MSVGDRSRWNGGDADDNRKVQHHLGREVGGAGAQSGQGGYPPGPMRPMRHQRTGHRLEATPPPGSLRFTPQETASRSKVTRARWDATPVYGVQVTARRASSRTGSAKGPVGKTMSAGKWVCSTSGQTCLRLTLLQLLALRTLSASAGSPAARHEARQKMGQL